MSEGDTSYLIDLVSEDPGAIQFDPESSLLSTTSISAAEFPYGVGTSAKTGVIEAATAFSPILPFDAGPAALHAEIAAGFRDSGDRTSSFDELIAAAVLRHGEEIISREAHFSAIPGLRVVSVVKRAFPHPLCPGFARISSSFTRTWNRRSRLLSAIPHGVLQPCPIDRGQSSPSLWENLL
ncbi:MAG TPA: PIN domain-containing protein [Methanolinea sp.]|nr:PIN domain-containing protein [Methanolinea sp.]HQK56635.1 PIN domain-containing protein [Methanolinea sp.]